MTFTARTASLRGPMYSTLAANIGPMQYQGPSYTGAAYGMQSYTAPSGDATEPSTAQTVGDALHTTASVINNIIDEGNATQRQQLHDASLERIAELQAQAASVSDPLLRQQIQQQQAALQQTLAALNAVSQRQNAPAPDNTKLFIGLGVAGIVVIGGLMFVMSRRNNPAEIPAQNPVVGHGRSRHFIPQHILDRRARKRAARRAAAKR